MVKEFKEFIAKGNVLDLAIGIIIGGAIGKIIASLVEDILMPLFGLVLGGVNFQQLKITVGSASVNYGLFIQAIIDFLIIAFCIFMFIKLLDRMKKKKVEEPAVPAAPSREEQLLTEIRDLLKKD